MIEVVSQIIRLSTRGDAEMVDITDRCAGFVQETGMHEGVMTIFGIGSTTGITTIEFEPGLQKDLPELLDRIAPPGRYHHDRTWGDGNGHAHLRSSLIGTSYSVPVLDGRLQLGTWQQVVFIDFDNRARERRIVLQIMGERAQ